MSKSSPNEAAPFWKEAAEVRLGVVRPKAGSYAAKLHQHPFYEMAAVFSGECDWVFDSGRPVRLKEGQIMVLRPHTLHQEKTPEGGRARLGWIGFGFPNSVEWKIPCGVSLKPGIYWEEISRLFHEIYEELSGAQLGGEYRANLCLRELMVLLARTQEKKPASRPQVGGLSTRQIQMVQAAAEYLRRNVESPLQLEALARYHSIQGPHLSSLFRRHFGFSPQTFLQQERIKKAKALLEDPHLTTRQVALQCGYYDESDFVRRFRRAAGLTPGRWRE